MTARSKAKIVIGGNQGAAYHGATPHLKVSPRENIYLRFNLSYTLPAATPGSEVGRATLKLYVGSVKTAGKLDLYAVGGESGRQWVGDDGQGIN